jgi:superfamily I DNA/RNA helicase
LFSYNPTIEQNNILNDCLNHSVSVINAFAGTGKTSTLVMLTELYWNRKFLYLAYNKSIELEAREKFNIDNNVKVKTTHALAYAYVARHTNINLKNVTNIKIKEIADRYNIDYKLASFVSGSLQNYCNSGSIDIVALPKVKSIVKMLLDDIELGVIAPTFDFILKKFHLLLVDNKVSIKEDILLLDEGQDTNDVTLAIFRLISAKNKIVVGDRHQQIYAFRGSKNALAKIDGEKYYLTESFRFNKKIAKNANMLLHMFKGETIPLVSNRDDFEEFNDAFGNQKYTVGYISKNNTTLVSKMLTLIANGYKFVTVRNPDEIFRLILDVGYVFENLKSKISYQNKYLKTIDSGDDLKSYIDDSGDIELETAIKIYEKNGLESIQIAHQVAKKHFNSQKNCRIVLTTAHSSKGLEWDIVTVENDFLDLAYIMARFALNQSHLKIDGTFDFLQYFIDNIEEVDDEDINAINLLYVAFTRAKKSINIHSVNIAYLEMDKSSFNKNVFSLYASLSHN